MKTIPLLPVQESKAEEKVETIEKSSNNNSTVLPEINKTASSVQIEDAYLFLQCEEYAYVVEKSLGEGEKMYVRDGSIIGISKTVKASDEKGQHKQMTSLIGPGNNVVSCSLIMLLHW